jgi:hypothetical protein
MRKFDDVGTAESVVWDLRLADAPRSENRAILNRLFNGEPPQTREEAEQNQNQVNRNFLEGTNLLSQARAQWNNAMLKQANYFGVTLDSGPIYKRQAWSHVITKNINRQLKRSRQQMEQIRAEGAQVILHGIAPSTFTDRRNPILKPMPISSWLTPSETDLDLSNLEYQAFFHEWTPYQLYQLTHGPKRDPGWNMEAVEEAWKYARDQIQKEPSSSNYQFMPERIAELAKQDVGYWGSDAVPTIDVWDVYFREAKDGDGWYRRIFLDWGVGSETLTKNAAMPQSRNTTKNGEYGGFLYTSGKRKYANSLGEIVQCQFGDCSAVAPFKLHSVRSLGWLLWGVADIMNQLHCRFTENILMQFLWWFRVSGQGDFNRVKKAMFENMGVIPAGISMIPAAERYKPDFNMVEFAFAQNKKIMGENAASFTNDMGQLGNEETATGTMAKVHSVNALVGGMLTLAYEYSKFKYQEQCRRFCIKNSPYKMVRDFRLACIKDGVPPEMLDAEKWEVEPDRALGEGNKILEMAIVQFLQGIRKNLGPDAQRKVDYLSIVSATDQPKLAEDLAPIEGQKRLSPSTHDAQLASDRILRGLQFQASPEMVPEDYVIVWLGDMGTIIQQIQQSGGVGDMDKIQGIANLAQHVQQFLGIMGSNEEDKPKVKQYGDILGKMMNHVKAMAQRLQEQQASNGANGAAPDPKDMIKLQIEQAKGQAKLQNTRESHALRTAQHQAQFELEQQRKDRELAADIRRKNAESHQELVGDTIKTVAELHRNRLKSLTE